MSARFNIKTSPKPFCFALMPFQDAFDDVYELGIKGACERAGAYSERVDKQTFDGTVIERIYNQIAKADVVIADMTGKSANVFYEVGYAHALDKPTILLTQQPEHIPFNLNQYPHVIYDRGDLAGLLKQLQSKVEFFIQHPSPSDHKVGLELFFDDVSLASGTMTAGLVDGHYIYMPLVLQNISNKTFTKNDLNVAVHTSAYLGEMKIHNKVDSARYSNPTWDPLPHVILPNDECLYQLPPMQENLFPESVYSIELNLSVNTKEVTTDQRIAIRVYTSAGVKDFMFTLQVASR